MKADQTELLVPAMTDDLDAARGIIIAVLLSLVLWAVLAAVIYSAI